MTSSDHFDHSFNSLVLYMISAPVSEGDLKIDSCEQQIVLTA